MSKIDLYYFSGTGNSLHVAKELQKRIPDIKIIPIVSLLNKDVIETSAETVGFVFPIYFTTVPLVVKNFIKKLDLKSTSYLFAIATRGGTFCRAFIDIDKVLMKKGRGLDAYFILNMAYNDPKFKYSVPTREELAKLESAVQDRLDRVHKIIVNKEKSREKDTTVVTPMPFILEKLMPLITAISSSGPEYKPYADAKCTGCGTCERVCLSGRIKMTDGKPVWRKNVRCFTCDACLNFCPKQSVQLESPGFIKFQTLENGRYSHPYATVDDIAGQKS